MNSKVKIEITGKTPMYFVKEIIRRKINIYFLNQTSKTIQIIIDEKDYKKIKELKTTYSIKVIKRYGINKYFSLIKKNRLLIFFFSISIILIIFLSNIIIEINIVHPNNGIRELVRKDLEKYGLKKYHLKVSYKQKEKIKRQILEKEQDEIEWLEIEEHGTKYTVRVESRKIPQNEKECLPRNVVAKKNAIITNISASSGEILKRQNDYVEKGEILISGLIHNKEEIVSKTCATGKVFGETWYTMKISIPSKYKVVEKKDNNSWGFHYNLFKNERKYGNKFYTFKKDEYNIIDSKILPLKLAIVHYTETIEKNINYTDSELLSIALNLATKKIERKLSKGERLIDKKVLKKSIKDSKIEIEVFLKLEEDITTYFDISNIDIETEKKE